MTLRGSTVTPDGSFVDFVRRQSRFRSAQLWRVPLLGGTPKRAPGGHHLVASVGLGARMDGHMAYPALCVRHPGRPTSWWSPTRTAAHERVLARPRRVPNPIRWERCVGAFDEHGAGLVARRPDRRGGCIWSWPVTGDTGRAVVRRQSRHGSRRRWSRSPCVDAVCVRGMAWLDEQSASCSTHRHRAAWLRSCYRLTYPGGTALAADERSRSPTAAFSHDGRSQIAS